MKFFSPLLLLCVAHPSVARMGIERILGKPTDTSECDNISFKGNGFPSGKSLFKFNVLGRDTNKFGSDFSPNGDRAIIVALGADGKPERTDIKLLNGSEGGDAVCNGCKGGSDFCIIDPNGVDDGEAKICVRDPFQDPDTGEDPCSVEYPESCNELAVYAIFARTVGKGSASAGLCVDITTSGGDTISDCYTGSVVINPKKATDISQELLTVCVEDQKVGLFDELCTNGDGELGPCKGEYNNPTDEEYYWAYDNEGNRRAEFRFYDAKVLNQLTGTECFGVTRGGAIC